VRWNAALAAVLAAGALAEMAAGGVGSPLLYAAALVATLALALRRYALAAPAVSLAAFALPVVVAGRQLPTLGAHPVSVSLTLAWLVAVYTIGAHPVRSRALLGLLAVLALCGLYAFGPGAPAGSTYNDLLAAVLFSGVVPWLAGYALARQRRARAADRAAEQAQADALAERIRIAREVHDLVAHSISVMVIQAEAGEAMLESAPARAAESLRAVQQAGRDALAEMRQTVAALRSGRPAAGTAGLDALPELLDSVRAAGLPVTVVTDGTPGELSRAADESAYSIVREALTNALRHSDHAGVAVRLCYHDDSVEISVLDQGRPVRRRLPGGHGLTGLREAVTAAGGSLNAGPTPDGQHLVHAVVPAGATR
jgi:signal transduction histidine kinase